MSTYPNLKNDPELLNIKTKYDEIKDSKDKTERNDHENILKPPKIDKEHYKKKYKSFNKRKIFIIITELLTESTPATSSSTMGLINPGADDNFSSSTALLTSMAVLITNEYISKLKIKYTKLRYSAPMKFFGTVRQKFFDKIS